MRHIVLLGSTGSIGTQTLDVIRHQPQCAKVEALAAGGGRIPLLEEQTREFMPRLVAVYDEKAAADLRVRLQDTPVRVVSGMAGLLEACAMEEADMVVTAMVGMIGLEPTVEAIRRHKTIALANKETLVCAGALIMRMAQEEGVQILPVDSEHSAIFQCLDGRGPETVRRILLTASGGPFRGWTWEQLISVRPEQALKHPNWSMGAKITIDSATMMNKGLEMIEARWLFGGPSAKHRALRGGVHQWFRDRADGCAGYAAAHTGSSGISCAGRNDRSAAGSLSEESVDVREAG